MKIIEAGYEILNTLDGFQILKHLERIGRVCYKSEDKITDASCIEFIKKIIKKGHEAVIEHYSFSVRFICDRGVSHEIVRHRIASFAQESTRYCNYGGDDIVFILPCWFTASGEMVLTEGVSCELQPDEEIWYRSMENAEIAYNKLIARGWTPQEARSILPNSLKTEIIMTTNLREWRHFLKLRTANAAHPQMREIAVPLLEELKELIPVVFDDIGVSNKK